MTPIQEPNIIYHDGLWNKTALGEFDPRTNTIHLLRNDVICAVVMAHEREHWEHSHTLRMKLLRRFYGYKGCFFSFIGILLSAFLLNNMPFVFVALAFCLSLSPQWLLAVEEMLVERKVYRKFKEVGKREELLKQLYEWKCEELKALVISLKGNRHD